ncbi:MAG: MarR family transcriptional regulator [Synergistaceae bacterium]|jgi:DNA-binding IclR family transcriptional regulator|nr:MarR family transcriptional regulator [Sphaerochaetaceae bacterium]
MTQEDVLDLLREWGYLTVEELAYLMGCHKSNASRMCRQLRAYGLIGFFEERISTMARHVYFLR